MLVVMYIPYDLELHSYSQGPLKMHTQFKGTLYFTPIRFTMPSI